MLRRGVSKAHDNIVENTSLRRVRLEKRVGRDFKPVVSDPIPNHGPSQDQMLPVPKRHQVLAFRHVIHKGH